jgi:hypothetical protein
MTLSASSLGSILVYTDSSIAFATSTKAVALSWNSEHVTFHSNVDSIEIRETGAVVGGAVEGGLVGLEVGDNEGDTVGE